MAKNAINYIGTIPETGDSFESATQNTTGSLNGIDTKLGELNSVKLEKGEYVGNAQSLKNNIDTNLTTLSSAISARTEKGTYSGTAGQLKAMIDSLATTGTITPDLKNYMELLKNENGVKVVQGVPVGGQKYLGNGVQTGAIKIKLPTAKSDIMFKLEIEIFDYTQDSGSKYILSGTALSTGFGATSANIAGCKASIIKNNNNKIKNVYFCTGATEDYILLGEVTDVQGHCAVTVKVLEYHYSGIAQDWSTGWGISLVTTLETLDSTKKVTVTPSLNATHLGGTMTSNAQGGITQKKTSTMSLEVENDTGTTFFNVDTTIGKVTQRIPTTTTPTNNQEMEFQLTSNTQLTIKVKGTDGVVRSANITLS